MFKKLLGGIKQFFSTDPSDMEPEELVALVANRETAEPRRRAGAEALASVSDQFGDLEDDEKGGVSNRAYSTLVGLLARTDEPAWITEAAIQGMSEIANVGRYDMDASVLEASVTPLIDHLGQRHAAGTRSAACSALASVDDIISDAAARRSIDAIIELMRAESGELRSSAIFSLGCFDSERTGELWSEVSGYLEDPSSEVRSSATSALWMIGNEEPDAHVIERLISMLSTEQGGRLRSNIVDALGHLGRGKPAVVTALSEALADEDTRHMAIFALSSLEEEADPAVGKLSVLLNDQEHAQSAVMALQEIGTDAARAALREAGHPEED